MFTGIFLEKAYLLQKINLSNTLPITGNKKVTHQESRIIKVRTSPLVNRLMMRRRKRRFNNIRPYPLAVQLRRIYSEN